MRARPALGSRAVHRPNPPSIDPGVLAFVWAFLLAVFIYFGLKAVGASGAFSIVMALLGFAAIWLFVRLRGEDHPGT
jgi:high-affinity Fe2+/Pb2+ permease